jgi:hypothetical protein
LLPGLAGNFGESNLGGIVGLLVALRILPIVRERRSDRFSARRPRPGMIGK